MKNAIKKIELRSLAVAVFGIAILIVIAMFAYNFTSGTSAWDLPPIGDVSPGTTATAISPVSMGRLIRITNDDNRDSDPVIRDNQIVWVKANEDHSSDIYYLKVPGTLPPNYTPTPIAITNDDLNQATPTICGSTIYYSEEGRIMYRDVQQSSPNSYQLCTDQMREDGRCRGYGYGVDCSATAVTYIYEDSSPQESYLMRFDLDDSLHFREQMINRNSVERQLPIVCRHWIDGGKRPQISADGSHIVFSEIINGYMADDFQAYYFEGDPPQPPFSPYDPPWEFPKFVAKDYFNNQYNVDIEDNIVVWAQAGEYYGNRSNIYMKDIVSGSLAAIYRSGRQTMPVISGNFIAYFNGYGPDIMLYDIANDIHHTITDPQETIDREITREGLGFEGDTIVWNEQSNGEPWDIYMFKLSITG